jgi:hypothetical protein
MQEACLVAIQKTQIGQRLQRKRQFQNPGAEQTRLWHDRILDAARSLPHSPETCCSLGATSAGGPALNFDLPADRLHPLQFCLTIIRRKLVPYNYSTHTRQLQLPAWLFVCLSVLPTQIARRIRSPKMDVAVLRGRIVATLDADADARRRAELDLKTVSIYLREPQGLSLT